MKRHLLYFLFFLAVIQLNLSAQKKNNKQNNSGGSCFGENSKVINAGIGYWGSGYYHYGRIGGYTYHSTPVLNLSYEQSITKAGPGYLGLGAYLGYQSFWWRYDRYYYAGDYYYYKHSLSYLLLAARCTYHAEALMTDKAELYFGLNAGLIFRKYSFSTNTSDPDIRNYELHESAIYPGGTIFIGGRAYLNPQIGVFAELGYGFSWLTAGLSIKLD